MRLPEVAHQEGIEGDPSSEDEIGEEVPVLGSAWKAQAVAQMCRNKRTSPGILGAAELRPSQIARRARPREGTVLYRTEVTAVIVCRKFQKTNDK